MFPQTPGIDRGPQRSGEHPGTPPGLYSQHPQIASSNNPQWSGGSPQVSAPSREKIWQEQQQDLKHREYLKQQQRLKAMGVPNNKNVSADALIGNLLEKKDTFRPKQATAAPLPVHGMSAAAPIQRVPTEQRPNDELPPWIWPGSTRLPPVYVHIWTLVVDPASGGTLVDTNRIFPLLLTSGLPTQVLGFIWNLAAQGVPGYGENQGSTGQLTQQQLYVVLALVSLAQTGCTFNSLSILKMLPQPPIPMFNMGTKSSVDSDVHSASVAPSPVVPTPASAPYQPPPAPVIPNTPIPVTAPQLSLQQPTARHEDSFFEKEDDFTDFQSAESSIPTATVVQPSLAAKQVVSELNHSVIARLNQGRSIGSRLANHTLGASRSRHHKHRERRPSMEPYFDDEVTFSGPRARKSSTDSYVKEESYRPGETENDDFNEFQMAIGLNVDVDELFPKCKQIKKQTVLLKESAIRNESDANEKVDILSLDPPEQTDFTHSEPAPIEPPKVPPLQSPPLQPPPLQPPPLQPPPIQLPPVQPPPIQLPPHQSPPLQAPPIQPPGGKELMTVQEDKYSALRFLELESMPAASDDFGDFVSAEDSFAEIAERKPSDPGPSLLSISTIAETNTESLETERQNVETKVEFPVDDWLSFDSSSVESRPVLEELSSIFSSLNVGQKGSHPHIEVTKSEPEDEFGDFVGPDMWGEDGKPPTHTTSDNRSVSSFEMSNELSRHGSLPSLDLNIFPSGDDSLEKFKEGCIPINEWQRCLDCCVSLLQSALNTFTSISSQDVVLEVLGTAEGRAYFTNLNEVRNVCNRIRYSYYRGGQEFNQIDTLLKAAQQAWDSLGIYYRLADIDTVDNENREDNGTAPCCICCCPASTGSLEYNGRFYHASCANLWLNCESI